MKASAAVAARAVTIDGQPGMWRVTEVVLGRKASDPSSWLLEPVDGAARASLRSGAKMRRLSLTPRDVKAA
jgi:hypothetical protein